MKAFAIRIFSSRLFRVLIGTVISLVSIWLAVRNVSLPEVGKVLREANLVYIFLALATTAFSQVAKAVRWRIIFGQNSRNASLINILMTILVGQAFNSIYPARIGDLSRVYMMGKLGNSRTFTLGTIVLEKLVDLLFYSLLFVLLLLLIPLPVWIDSAFYVVAIPTVFAFGLALLIAFRLQWFTQLARRLLFWLPERWREHAERRMEDGLSSLRILKNRSDLIKIFILSGLVWGTSILNNVWILRSLDLSLPLTAPLLVLVVLQASVSLPQVIPAGIGLYEYLVILSLAVFGVPQTTALGYGILLHAVTTGLIILLGLLSLFLWGCSLYPRKRRIGAVNRSKLVSMGRAAKSIARFHF